MLLVVLFLCCLATAILFGFVPLELAGLYMALSLITFAVYAWDKSAAKGNRWRIKERTLHLLALCGGWPGAHLAHNKLRHKSVKVEFRRVYWLTVVVNLAILLWSFTRGAEFIASIIK